MKVYPPASRYGIPRFGPSVITNRGRASSNSSGSGSAYSGAGSPEGSQSADPGSTYVQTDTLRLWYKVSGTGDTGWQAQAKVSAGTGGPEGVVTGSPGDVYYDTSSGTVYFKASGSDSNTGWA